MGRRTFLRAAGSLAATPLLGGIATEAAAQAAASSPTSKAQAIGRRRLGALEVSSVGLAFRT